MITIKLGGSVISDKNEPFSFNEEAVRNIAKEISEFYPSYDFVLVHGGGSFGHPLAKKYGIRDGAKEKQIEKLVGFSRTHEAMLDLNKKIIDIFLDENLPAFSVSPSSIFIMDKNEIYGSIDVIQEAIKMKMLPILFGDVVIERSKGIDILSGDLIMSYISNKMNAEKAIFLMDVDGIYTKNPSCKDARLIEEIERGVEIEAMKKKFDVTGGIKNKIMEAMKMDCDVYFINGMVKGNLTKAIKGEKVGTIKKRK